MDVGWRLTAACSGRAVPGLKEVVDLGARGPRWPATDAGFVRPPSHAFKI